MENKEKEKAKELLNKYDEHCYICPTNNNNTIYHRKQCALFDVNGTLQALNHHKWQNRKIIKFYKKVKEEINKHDVIY
jgi:galactose-1-phosphate uridylyltransferase